MSNSVDKPPRLANRRLLLLAADMLEILIITPQGYCMYCGARDETGINVCFPPHTATCSGFQVVCELRQAARHAGWGGFLLAPLFFLARVTGFVRGFIEGPKK